MYKSVASAVCALAFIAGDLRAEQNRYPAPLEVKEPKSDTTYGYLECFRGGSKIECDSAMSNRQVAMEAGDIRWLLEGMAKLLRTVQPRR